MRRVSTPPIHPYGFDPELHGWLNIMILASGHMGPGSVANDSSRLFKMAQSRLVGSNVSAVTLISKGLVKCLMVPANRSLSTFDKIPRVCSVESLASEGLVSGKGVQVGNSLARKVDSASESFQPIFLATLRLVFDRTW